MTSSPLPTTVQDGRRGLTDIAAITDTADILRQVAHHDAQIDAFRGDVSASLAALLEACGRDYLWLPDDIAQRALRVAHAVDRATGHRR
jgi:hypothetical protein